MSRKKLSSNPNTIKGRLVERIAVWLHKEPGLIVRRNVELPSIGGNRGTREIDVLISGHVAGYPLDLAIECKNEAKPIGVEKIDAFVGKLQDVGISPRSGIYISASGYTSGATGRAIDAGIRPLLLTGLTSDRLSAAVRQALQSVVHLLLDVKEVSITSNVDVIQSDALGLLWFRNDEGNVCGCVMDIIWQRWQSNDPPSALGLYKLNLKVPSGWRCIIGVEEVVVSITATVRVIALVIMLPGYAEDFILSHAASGIVERIGVRSSFDLGSGSYPVTAVDSEAALDHLLGQGPDVQVTVGRVRLPRIRRGPSYWPPSERVAHRLFEHWRATVEDGLSSSPPSFEDLEGLDMSTVWEPIWSEHPAAKDTTSPID